MTFTEQLVKKKNGAKQWALIVLIWFAALALASFALYFSMGVMAQNGSTGFFFFAILLCFGLGWGAIKLTSMQHIEFEYNVFEGGLDIDKIVAKSKRTRIVQVSAAKIEQLSPIAALDDTKYDRIVMAAPSREEATWFVTYHSKKNGHTIAMFAPSEELLEYMYKEQTRPVQIACDKLRKEYNV